MPLTKIYGYYTVRDGEELGVAITEDGNTVALAHDCPAIDCEGRLGMKEGSTDSHDIYNAMLGIGQWETEYVDTSYVNTHEGLQAALAAEAAAVAAAFQATLDLFAGKE